jgi:hypothetical protein
MPKLPRYYNNAILRYIIKSSRENNVFLFSHQYMHIHMQCNSLYKKLQKKKELFKASAKVAWGKLGEPWRRGCVFLEDFEEPRSLISSKVMFFQRLCVCISSKIGFSSSSSSFHVFFTFGNNKRPLLVLEATIL